VFNGRQLFQTLLLALIVGGLLTGINQGETIAQGNATAETWIQTSFNLFVVFAIANIGLLAGRVSAYAFDSSPDE
jgi:hypothetical protein